MGDTIAVPRIDYAFALWDNGDTEIQAILALHKVVDIAFYQLDREECARVWEYIDTRVRAQIQEMDR